MDFTRREFARLALAGLPAAALIETPLFGSPFVQAKPNSMINGVQVGTITYSFRSMPDQSAEAILKYVVDSGVSAIEFMGDPVERFAGAPSGRGGGAGRAGAAAPGRGAGRNPAGAGGEDGPARAPFVYPVPPLTTQTSGAWSGQACAAPRGGGPGRADAAAAAPAAPAGGDAAPAGNRGGGGGRGGQSPEQQEAAAALRNWRTSVSMDAFKRLRKMFNDAGVQIYAWKQLSPNMTDEEMEYVFNVAEALGCTHTTLELPGGSEAGAQLRRIGDFAIKKKIYAAYHTHLQGSITAFDEAFAVSKGNMANVDLGHYVAAGGDPIAFLQKFHDRISSFHLKDRTTPDHCGLNLPWGAGETPLTELLQMVKKNKWTMPATVELEVLHPAGLGCREGNGEVPPILPQSSGVTAAHILSGAG